MTSPTLPRSLPRRPRRSSGAETSTDDNKDVGKLWITVALRVGIFLLSIWILHFFIPGA